MDAKELGRAIRERRKYLGISQQMLADLAEIGINTLVALERGQGNPRLDTLLSVLKVLGLKINLSLRLP